MVSTGREWVNPDAVQEKSPLCCSKILSFSCVDSAVFREGYQGCWIVVPAAHVSISLANDRLVPLSVLCILTLSLNEQGQMVKRRNMSVGGKKPESCETRLGNGGGPSDRNISYRQGWTLSRSKSSAQPRPAVSFWLCCRPPSAAHKWGVVSPSFSVHGFSLVGFNHHPKPDDLADRVLQPLWGCSPSEWINESCMSLFLVTIWYKCWFARLVIRQLRR